MLKAEVEKMIGTQCEVKVKSIISGTERWLGDMTKLSLPSVRGSGKPISVLGIRGRKVVLQYPENPGDPFGNSEFEIPLIKLLELKEVK